MSHDGTREEATAKPPIDEFVYVSEPTTTWSSRKDKMVPPPGVADGDTFTDSTGLKWTATRVREEDPLPFDAIDDLAAALARLRSSVESMPLDKQALFSLFSVAHGLSLRCAEEAQWARRERDHFRKLLIEVMGGGERRADAAARGRVYFIQSTAPGDLIKIGFSTHPKGRLAALQTSHGHPLKLLHAERGTKKDENALHKQFAKHRAEGEWFRPAPELLDYIASRVKPASRASAS